MKKRRFRIHFNIGTVMFGILFIYLCITLILFATKRHVETWQVISGPLSGNDTYTALIRRNEEVVKSSVEGYVNYFVQDVGSWEGLTQQIRSDLETFESSCTK